MALTYQQKLAQLSGTHSRYTQYELETQLGLKHGGQGKTLRRYKTGERTPSKEVQSRIDVLYQALIEAQMYVNPINPEHLREIKRDWKAVEKRWKRVTNASLKQIMRLNYHAANKEYDADFIILVTLDRPRRVIQNSFHFLSAEMCTFRTVLVDLTFALTHMAQKQWYAVAQETLAALQVHKPRVYRDMKRVIDSL